MKKIIGLFILISFVSVSLTAQKIAYIDTDFILESVPTYATAKEELDKFSEKWQKEVEDSLAEIDKLDKAFQAEKVLLTEEMRKKQEAEILAKIKAAKEMQKKYFGKEGELYKKRNELVKPIQDEIFLAVKEIAKENSLDFILDKAGSGISILFANPKYDKSDDVLEKMGFKKKD